MGINRFKSAFAGLFAVMIGPAAAVAEQAGSVNPQEHPVYQTQGITIGPGDMTDWAEASYWEQKLGHTFKLIVDQRMKADAEERDAVLATVWQAKPRSIDAKTRIIAFIPGRSAKPQTKDLAYQITFIPRTEARGKDRVETRFVSEGVGARPVAMPPAPAALRGCPGSIHMRDFPKVTTALDIGASTPAP